MDIAASPSLVVVGKVDIKDVALLKAEHDPPVSADRDAPKTFEIAPQGMEPPAGKQAHLTRLLGGIECGEDVRDLLGLASGNAAAVVIVLASLARGEQELFAAGRSSRSFLRHAPGAAAACRRRSDPPADRR